MASTLYPSLSASRVMAAFDSMSSRYSAGYGFDYATCNLSSLPDFSTFYSARVLGVPRKLIFVSLNVDASGHAVHGMKKHVRYGDLVQSSTVVCSVVTASRCEVATHVATLVFGCKVSMACESNGRHSHSLLCFKCPADASQIRRHPVFCAVEKQQFPRFWPVR